MNRRHFLKLPLGAAALTLISRAADSPAAAPRATAGVRVAANEDRYGEELSLLGGSFDLKVSGRDTGGDLCIYDTMRHEKGGPALHRHHRQDEWFYVVRGEFIVQVGNDTLRLRPGDSAFAPRMVPHAFALVSEGVGQMLVLFQPAGNMEDFFLQMSRIGKDAPRRQDASIKQLWLDHGMELLGPPLKFG
jgi:mannose-6-phosphate isomerase-like protein (cupin superfamily)